MTPDEARAVQALINAVEAHELTLPHPVEGWSAGEAEFVSNAHELLQPLVDEALGPRVLCPRCESKTGPAALWSAHTYEEGCDADRAVLGELAGYLRLAAEAAREHATNPVMATMYEEHAKLFQQRHTLLEERLRP